MTSVMDVVGVATPTAPTINMDAFEEAYRQGEVIRQEHQFLRRQPPDISLWTNGADPDDGLIERGNISDCTALKASWKKNRAATATVLLRADHHIARWLMRMPNDNTLKKNCVLRVDSVGKAMRWTGLLKNWTLRKRDGVRFLEVTFVDDIQFLQYLLGAPNPVLPIDIFQFPRVFAIIGPSCWAISLIIWLNLMRVQAALWNLPDDPFDGEGWDGPFDMNDWQVLIKSPTFMQDSSLWTLLASRMDPVDKVIEDALDDGQLYLSYRRVFTNEGETVTGIAGVTHPRNGVLVFEVLDRSGYFAAEGTGTGGNAFDGFRRTVTQFIGGFIEQVDTFVSDNQSFPSSYFVPNWDGRQAPSHPWIVLTDSDYSNIESSELSWAPSGPVQVVVGGGNEFVDTAVELAIQTVGNLLSYFFLAGFSSGGDIAATVIMPMLRGTILAWNKYKSSARVQNLGWVHLMEMFQQGANNAWTLSAIAALRTGLAATKSTTGHAIELYDGGPYLPGIHILPADRVGSTVQGMTDSISTDPIFVDQVEEMTLAFDWQSDAPHSWEVKIGQNKAMMTWAERSSRLLSKALATLQNLGVSII